MKDNIPKEQDDDLIDELTRLIEKKVEEATPEELEEALKILEGLR